MDTAWRKSLLLYLSLFANFVLILVLVYTFTVYSKTKVPQQPVTTNQVNEELAQYKAKSIPLPFNPKAKYVNSTLVYQQIIGTVTSFNSETSLLTLSNKGETFTVSIPLGKNSSYIPPALADVKDINIFKNGDEVTIGGSVDTAGEFKVSKFVISKKVTKE